MHQRRCQKVCVSLTQQQEEAGQDGEQGRRAESRRPQEGRLLAAERTPPVCVARTHPDREGAGAAEGGGAGVGDQHGQQVERPLPAQEPRPPGQHGGGVVWREQSYRARGSFTVCLTLGPFECVHSSVSLYVCLQLSVGLWVCFSVSA